MHFQVLRSPARVFNRGSRSETKTRKPQCVNQLYTEGQFEVDKFTKLCGTSEPRFTFEQQSVKRARTTYQLKTCQGRQCL